MIELCKINRLKVVRDTPQGLYLEEEHKEDSENCRNETKDMKDISGTEHLKKEKTSSAARFTGSREDVLLPGPEVPERESAIQPGRFRPESGKPAATKEKTGIFCT